MFSSRCRLPPLHTRTVDSHSKLLSERFYHVGRPCVNSSIRHHVTFLLMDDRTVTQPVSHLLSISRPFRDISRPFSTVPVVDRFSSIISKDEDRRLFESIIRRTVAAEEASTDERTDEFDSKSPERKTMESLFEPGVTDAVMEHWRRLLTAWTDRDILKQLLEEERMERSNSVGDVGNNLLPLYRQEEPIVSQHRHWAVIRGLSNRLNMLYGFILCYMLYGLYGL